MRSYQTALAVAVAAAIIVATLLLSGRTAQRQGQEQGTPEAAVWALFEAQKKGQVRRYLAQLTGEMRRRADQSVREMGIRAFADYLRSRDFDVKAIAIKGRQEHDATTVTIFVDLVYLDGQEEYRFDVVRMGRTWRIASVVGGERHPSLIPYGTAVAPPDSDRPQP